MIAAAPGPAAATIDHDRSIDGMEVAECFRGSGRRSP
jgi:hypothetical protein